MAKGNSSRSNNKSSSRNAASSSSRRPKPMTPKAGYTQTRRRYGEGGKANY